VALFLFCIVVVVAVVAVGPLLLLLTKVLYLLSTGTMAALFPISKLATAATTTPTRSTAIAPVNPCAKDKKKT